MVAPPDKNAEVLSEVLKLLNDLLNTGDWTHSLYLKNSYKKFKQHRDDVQALLDEAKGVKKTEVVSPEKVAAQAAAKAESLNVFVSVFQTDPNNLLAWQNTLGSITEYSVTRPIYQDEAHALEFIRSRPDPTREGYAEIVIQSKDILPDPSGKPRLDQFEHELLSVREGTILPENIVRFIHGDKIYHFKQGELQHVEDRNQHG